MGVNMSKPLTLDFVRQDDGSYVFDDKEDELYQSLGGFFPIEGDLLGNSDGTPDRNFHFTFELHTTFTYDHIIREPGTQYSGGGTDGAQHQTGVERGGGYIGGVHMDYTDNTTWERYLALHGHAVPSADRVYALNFWRPLSASVDDHPLAVCDARTVQSEDLLESEIYGYGAANYSWHDIGIETFSVSASVRQRWYYYPGMTPNDVLVIKSYDSAGVIGTTCPHASFAHPHPTGEPRRSIELRVLCFC